MMLRLLMLAVVAMGANLPDDILSPPDWGFQSYLDEDFSLHCNHSSLIVKATDYVAWELPDGTILTKGTDKFVLANANGVVNMKLKVTDVKESDAGVYVCHVRTGGQNSVLRGRILRGLNLGGHKYRVPFDEYRDQLLVGGIAGLVLFVFLCSLCLIYKFRYQTSEQKQAKINARLEATKHQRYLAENGANKDAEMATSKGEANPAYENADDVNTRL